MRRRIRMNCICGYIHEEEWDKEIKGYRTTVGDKGFIRVDGKFTVEDGDGYYRALRDVTVHACPKRGTLKVDL
jgi:hypothetical protein